MSTSFAPAGPATGLPTPDLERAVQVFMAERSRLVRVAQLVVGDRAAAEDAVQDAWLRWQRVDRDRVRNPAAFLTTTTVRLAINQLESARRRHEVPTDPLDAGAAGGDSADHAERTATTEAVLGVLMARLRPAELAAYLLRKGFDYPYGQIADLLRTSPPNARQLVRRAQLALAGSRARRVDRTAHRRLVVAYTAASNGDLTDLEVVLSHGSAPRGRRDGHGATVESQVRTRALGFTGAA